MATAQLGTLLRQLHLRAGSRALARSDRELLDDFAGRRDEAAFAALVSRHGPMVLRVCRRVLGHEQDAEDAFQATFLALAQHTASIRQREVLASWLHGVAYRTAMNAKRSAARRQNREAGRQEQAPSVSPSWDDVQAVLEEEIHRLPEVYRSAFVLCVLEGRSVAQAAAELAVKEGTVGSRLARARQRLQRRLTARGIQLGALLAATAVAESSLGAALPVGLARAVVRSGLLVAAGEPAAGVIPPHVAALAAGVTRAMFPTKAKIATLVLLAAGLFAAGAGALTCQALAGKGEEPHAAAKSDPPAPGGGALPRTAAGSAGKDSVTLSGQVLGTDGKPVPGARLYLIESDGKKSGAPKVRATTDKDGRFRFLGEKGASPLVAAADGYGPAWVRDPLKPTDLTIRLAKDDVPVSGRILDLQGKPVAGATITVNAVKAPVKGTLDAWLAAVKVRQDGIPAEYEHLSIASNDEIGHLFPKLTTDKEGRFLLAGVGRERVVALIVQGPTLQTMEINAITRPGVAPFTKPYYEFGGHQLTYYGASLDHATPPCRPITGVVRDRATGKPIAGAVVRVETGVGNPPHRPQATTDKQGRYRLIGIGKGEGQGQTILALSPEDQPYLGAKKKASGGAGLEPLSLDFELTKGVWLEGRVTDKATKRGVEAAVAYFVFESALQEGESSRLYVPYFGGGYRTDSQGKFRLVAHPGRGLVGVRAVGAAGERYRVGAGAEAIKGSIPSGFPGLIAFPTYPRHALPNDLDGLKEVNPAGGDKTVTCDIVLDPGRPLTVRVEGPAGEPLAGARVQGQLVRSIWSGGPVQAEFPVHGLKPGESRTLLFRHEGKGLAGLLKVKGDESGPLTVRLAPAAAVSGRLLDEDGRPLPHAEISVRFLLDDRPNWAFDHHPVNVYSDAAGKFRIDGLAPAVKYYAMVRITGRRYPASVFPSLALTSGQTKDLGDVTIKKNANPE
jgi:RNA polymerase sigma factor (sigma-70 family)